MDHYLTTYRKDYLWPNLPNQGQGGGPGAGPSRGPGGGAGGADYRQGPPPPRRDLVNGMQNPNQQPRYRRMSTLNQPPSPPRLNPMMNRNPYPNQQPMYPNQQPPYPNQQPPYPNQQPPYPNQQPPYPNQPSPYSRRISTTSNRRASYQPGDPADASRYQDQAYASNPPGVPNGIAYMEIFYRQGPPPPPRRELVMNDTPFPRRMPTSTQPSPSPHREFAANQTSFPRSIPKLSGDELAFYQACMQHLRPADCRCPQYSGANVQLPPGQESGWSRNELMGPLLDPKLYPVRVGAAPETATSRYNQPNAFLEKLQSKYPMLYSILQNEASPELKQRIDRDRNKTTYQVDFCESGPGAKFESLQRAQDESGTGPCTQPMRLPGDPCRVGPKGNFSVPKTISKQGTGGAADPRAKCETSSAFPPLGKTEYQDVVSKLGGIIMRDKLHRRDK